MKKRGLVVLLTAVIVVLGISIVAFGDTNTPGSSGDPVVSKSYVDAKTTYSPLQIFAGQTIAGKEGTEIILRSGEAKAVAGGANGISDITAGTDLMNGMQVGANHLLLVPRDDGRGIYAITDIWIMIRGDYTIK